MLEKAALDNFATTDIVQPSIIMCFGF